MTEKMTTLVTYTYNTEAYVLTARLDSEGIPFVLKNEHLLATQQFLSNAVGGLDVQVAEKDLARAKIILNELQEKQTEANKTPAHLGSDYENVLTYCPDCESSHVFRKKASFLSFKAREHRCGDCGHIWKQ